MGDVRDRAWPLALGNQADERSKAQREAVAGSSLAVQSSVVREFGGERRDDDRSNWPP